MHQSKSECRPVGEFSVAFMNRVRVVADSGCDISPVLAAKYEITIVPLTINFGQETVLDTELTPDEFWARAARSGQIPRTAAPSPGRFHDTLRPLIDTGDDVFCLTLPANYSGIFNSAWVASQEFGQRVRILDTGSISVGMGLQVLSAARHAMDGWNLDAVYRAAESMRDRTYVIFVLDTLEWVRRGGRVARLLPLIDRIGRAFQVKPVIEMINGELRLIGVARSSRGAIQRIEQEVRARLPIEAARTAYTRGQQLAVDLAENLSGVLNLPASDLVPQEAGPVFASHAGPNAVGVVVVRA
jgi:DegV family protein with EDD domain